jgi:chromate transporter
VKRHLPFLKQVLIHSLTAFGGPQAHLGMLQKTFVENRKDITGDELLEFNSFCNILPGASSTQVLTLIGYKRGGISLAIITLCIWILPAAFLMTLLSFFLKSYDKAFATSMFKYINGMAVGFLLYAATQALYLIKKNTIVIFIIIISTILIIFSFTLPWMFPLVLLAGGLITSISKKRIPTTNAKPKKIVWTNIYYFFIIMIIAGFMNELARKQNWDSLVRKPIGLFENTYRMGSFVFGGGQVLIPMMESQFCERFTREKVVNRNPNAININKEDFYTGAGIVRAIPGPVFSIATFTGGLALSNHGVIWQLFGALIGTIAIFLPSALLVLFFFPVWHNLKSHVTVYRAMEGINAAVVGLMLGSAIFLFKDLLSIDNQIVIPKLIFSTLFTWFLLSFSKFPAPVIVLFFLLLGIVF